MKIFAISDLHLSLDKPVAAGGRLQKPMDIFGRNWRDTLARLTASWEDTVAQTDVVLLPGDLSWAMTLEEARHDLAFIAALPGKKFIVKGNHDYWWQSLSKLKAALPQSIVPIQHGAAEAGAFAICGNRGWLLPGHGEFSENEDRRIYERECLRLKMALDEAAALDKPILLMLHYPPLNATADTGFTKIIAEYAVTACVYGHIHGGKQGTFEGEYRGVRYYNCSADLIRFQPVLIAEC